MTYAPKLVLQLPVSNLDLLEPFVDTCIRDGVVLIAIVGEGASKIDDLIDELVVGDGSDRSRFINTTFHPKETVAEVMEFARRWEERRSQSIELVKLCANNGHGRHYSITLSARASNAGETVTPIASAVLRLMTNSNLVGCSTGTSATLTPWNSLMIC